jgi:hypothetical protein
MLKKPYNLVLFAIGLFGSLILCACNAKAEGFSFETEKTSTREVSDQRIQNLSSIDRSTESICYSKKALDHIDFNIPEYCEFFIPRAKIKSHQSEIPLLDKRILRIHTGLSPPFHFS